MPLSLQEERDKYLQELSEGKLQDSNQQKEEDEAKELSFNQDTCFTKCIMQVLLIQTVKETFEQYYDILSLSVRIALIIRILTCLWIVWRKHTGSRESSTLNWVCA